MVGNFFARTAGRTAHEMVKSYEFKKGIALTAANIVGASVAGALLISPGTTFMKFLAGGTTAVATFGTKASISSHFDSKIQNIKEAGKTLDLHDHYIALADIGDWVNMGIVDEDGIEKETGKLIQGLAPKKISNSFTYHALVKSEIDDSGNQVYVGTSQYKMHSSASQLMQKRNGNVYTNEIIEDTPIITPSSFDIFQRLVKKHGADKVNKALAVDKGKESEQCYVTKYLEDYKPGWFGITKDKKGTELSKEYVMLKAIGQEYHDLLIKNHLESVDQETQVAYAVPVLEIAEEQYYTKINGDSPSIDLALEQVN